MQFDEFYKTIGVFGRYQKEKYFLICLTYMFPPIMVYSWSFTAATPTFQCQLESSTVKSYLASESQCLKYQNHLSIPECQRCFRQTNQSDELQPCTNFIFDRTYYQSTLVEEWSMVCGRVSQKSFVQIVFFFGYMIGSLVFGILSDKFGRRPVMGVSFIVITLASFMCAFAPQKGLGFEISYAFFILGRFLLSCATRGIALTGFVIGSEIGWFRFMILFADFYTCFFLKLVGPKQRSFTGIVIQYFFAGGELILLGFAIFIRTWRWLNIALAIVSVPFLFFYFVIPESPRWLISKGHYQHAERIFRRIAKANKTDFDETKFNRLINAEKKRAEMHPRTQHGLKTIFRSKIMLIIAANMSFQWFVQNLVFYGVSQNTGAWLANPYISFGASAIVEIAAYILLHLVLDRWGRKKPYCIFVFIFAFVAFLVLPVQILLEKDSRIQTHLMFIINSALKFLASGSYALIYIYANELFPTQIRNTGLGVCSMVARFGAIIGTLSNDILTRAWIHFPIVVFGAMSILAVGFATICPETVDRDLPQTVDDVELMGLDLPCRKSKKDVKLNGINNPNDDDADVALNQQLKENDSP